MKIAVITFQRSINYGAVMQGLALCKYLESLGHHVTILDYRPSYRRYAACPVNYRRFYRKTFLFNVKRFLMFKGFIEQNLPLSQKHFSKLEDFKEIRDHYDAIVCGSDQIWNAPHTGGIVDPVFFGAFGGEHTLRISYAASMGFATVQKEYIESFRDLLSSLDRISVRESPSAEYIREKFSLDCEAVVDPTLLEVPFAAFEAPIDTPADYILSYCLQVGKKSNHALEDVVSRYNIPLLQVRTKYRMSSPLGQVVSPQVGQWLTLFKNASFVVTNSFHGLAMAIRYKVPFKLVELEPPVTKRGERMTSLLASLGIELDDSGNAFTPQNGSDDPKIDWELVYEKLFVFRASSSKFIDLALTPAMARH